MDSSAARPMDRQRREIPHLAANGTFVPDDWKAIVLGHVALVRFAHMLLAAYVTSAFCVAATGAWYLLDR
jgi:cytochrome d ubiquinol oxidase subunit I